jgi:hypothetical protein
MLSKMAMSEELEEGSISPSDDQFDPSDDIPGSTSPRSLRRPMLLRSSPQATRRAQGKTFNSKHPTGREVPSFDSQTPPDETERRLVALFGPDFQEACVDDWTLSDRLSVRDLRVVIRVLDLLPADQVNVRKPVLCHSLQRHLQAPHMQAIWKQHMETRAESKEESEPSDEKEEKPKRQERTRQPASDRPAERPTRRKQSSEEKARRVVIVPRLRMERPFPLEEAVEFLRDCNQFVRLLSERIAEMEKAITILLTRIKELDKAYFGT